MTATIASGWHSVQPQDPGAEDSRMLFQPTRGQQLFAQTEGSTMAEVPQRWAAYARLQQKLSNTTNIVHGAALEQALSVSLLPNHPVHSITASNLARAAATAARRDRHRAQLRRQYPDDLPTAQSASDGGPDCEGAELMPGSPSLEGAVHARRELERIAVQLTREDITLLLDVAAGIHYEEIARGTGASAGALRTRVARLRSSLASIERPLDVGRTDRKNRAFLYGRPLDVHDAGNALRAD